MTRSHGKHHVAPPPPPPVEANGAEPHAPQTDDVGGVSPAFRVVVWLWALAFIALIVQAFLDFIFGALFGPAGG